MRTEHDLSLALEELAIGAPTAAEVLPPHRPSDTVRNWRLPVAAAAVAATVVAVPLLLIGHGASGSGAPPLQPTVSSSPAAPVRYQLPGALTGPGAARPGDLRRDFGLAPVAGCTSFSGPVTRRYEQADFSCAQSGSGSVYLFYQGESPWMGTNTPQPVGIVGGQPSYWATVAAPDGGTDKVSGLIWQYAAGGWALSVPPVPASKHSTAADRVLALKFARAVAPFTDPEPIKVPLQLDLPGLTLDEVDFDGTNGSVELGSGTATETWTIGYSLGDLGGSKPNRSLVTVHGRQWRILNEGDQSSLELILTGFGMTITSMPGHSYSTEQLTNIAGAVTLAPDITDPGTWFNSATVVPAS